MDEIGNATGGGGGGEKEKRDGRGVIGDNGVGGSGMRGGRKYKMGEESGMGRGAAVG